MDENSAIDNVSASTVDFIPQGMRLPVPARRMLHVLCLLGEGLRGGAAEPVAGLIGLQGPVHRVRGHIRG